jgi:hypothetical protein
MLPCRFVIGMRGLARAADAKGSLTTSIEVRDEPFSFTEEQLALLKRLVAGSSRRYEQK